MKLTKEQVDVLHKTAEGIDEGSSCRELWERYEGVDIPLPFECVDQTIFMALCKGCLYPITGSVVKSMGKLSLALPGWECVDLKDEQSLFEVLSKTIKADILDLVYLSNPLGLPKWQPIPECKMYRFHVYSLKTGWLGGSLHIGDGLTDSHWTIFNTGHDWSLRGTKCFFSSLKAYGYESINWIDPCDEIGEWPGNESESHES